MKCSKEKSSKRSKKPLPSLMCVASKTCEVSDIVRLQIVFSAQSVCLVTVSHQKAPGFQCPRGRCQISNVADGNPQADSMVEHDLHVCSPPRLGDYGRELEFLPRAMRARAREYSVMVWGTTLL